MNSARKHIGLARGRAAVSADPRRRGLGFCFAFAGVLAVGATAVAGCASEPASPLQTACADLNGTVLPASTMPAGDATITTTEWVAAEADFGAYCKVVGEVAPIDPESTPILFQINLPETWNNKVVQWGGGGLNGTLVQAVGLLRDAPPGSQPLARGYVTLGTDGGHPRAEPDIGVFMLNEEAYINNAYGSNKKAYDLSKVVMERFYGAQPQRYYFFGGSEGGRQAFGGIQRFPEDYDGIVAVVPAINHIGNNITKWNAYQATLDDGWMNSEKIRLLQDATTAACDDLDGLQDGVISHYTGCEGRFDVATLRCPGGTDTGDTCLSDAQINAVNVWRSTYTWGFPLKDGSTSLPGYPMGGEALSGSVNPWIMLNERPTMDTPATEMNAAQVVRYGVAQDPDFRGPIDLAAYRERIQWISELMDNTDPDLSAFQARGGKVIMKANGADYAVSPAHLFKYYDAVNATMGQDTVDGFLRFYVNPGVNHGGSGVQADGTAIPDKVDLLAVLDAWVEQDAAPGHLTVTAYDDGAPAGSRPLCLYGTYPRYDGSGDVAQATSYTCTPL